MVWGFNFSYTNDFDFTDKNLGKVSYSNRRLELILNTKKMPDEIFKISRPDLIDSLYIKGRHIELIPEEIAIFNNLKSLELELGEVRFVPVQIGQLIKLKTLVLKCKLQGTLPSHVFVLTNLEFLDLSFNYLTSLDSNISCLKKLKTLILKGNRTIKLPNELCKLKSLGYLDLWRTPYRSKNQIEDNMMKSFVDEFDEYTNLRKSIYPKYT